MRAQRLSKLKGGQVSEFCAPFPRRSTAEQDFHGDSAYLFFAQDSDVFFMIGKVLFLETTLGAVEWVSELLGAIDDAVELSGLTVFLLFSRGTCALILRPASVTHDTLHPSIGSHRFAAFSPTCTWFSYVVCRTLWVEMEDDVEALVALLCVFVPLDLMDSLNAEGRVFS